MRKKFLLFSSLLVSVNSLAVISCSKTPTTDEQTPPPIEEIIPNSYNLKDELLKLNQLDFERQNPEIDANQFDFLNSWFLNFNPLNKEEVTFKQTSISEPEKKLFYKSTLLRYTNWTDNTVAWVTTPEVKKEIDYQKYNQILSMPTFVDLNQEYRIIESLDSHYFDQSSLVLSKEAYLKSSIKATVTFPPQTFQVGPKKRAYYYQESFLFLVKINGFFQFNLKENTEVSYLVENKETKEKNVYHYQVQDLINLYQDDEKYQEILKDEQGFFYYDEESFKMQLPVWLQMLSSTPTMDTIQHRWEEDLEIEKKTP